MHVAATTERALLTGADTIAVGLLEGEPPAAGELGAAIGSLLDRGEARATFRHLALTHVDGRRVIAVGLGRRARLTPERARVAAGLVHRR
ncbi:MAG: hypothetical protein WBQ18_19770, partial [Solirubrobacteraceae bacterium]